MKTLMTAASALLLAAGLTAPADASVRVGILKCHTGRTTGNVVGSIHEARCIYTNFNGHREPYVARMQRVGLDVGFTDQSVLVWAVYAPTALHHHALAGDYVGASAEAAVGIGAGANVLVGGNAGTISLQPVSLKAETGLAVAGGLGKLELR